MPCLGLGVGAWVVVLVGLGHVGQVPGTWASENPCGPVVFCFPLGDLSSHQPPCPALSGREGLMRNQL